MNMNDRKVGAGKSPRMAEHGPLRALFSVLSAFFGVQSSRNLNRDDKAGHPGHFILFGLVATLALVGGLILFVNILMAQIG